MNLDKFYKKDIELIKITTIKDSIGSKTIESESYTTINGVIMPQNLLRGSEKLSADKPVVYSTHRLYCPINTLINRGEKLKFKDNYYKVLLVVDPMNMGKFLQVDLELIPHE